MVTRTTRSRRDAEQDALPRLEVNNPATGEVVGEVPLLDAAAVDALVARARAAQPAWAALSTRQRAVVVDRFRRRLAQHKALMIEALQAEAGKPWEDCNADVMLVIAWAQQWCAGRAERWLADEDVRSGSLFALGRRNVITRSPVGVVGVIGPWNVPLSLTVGDALPALLAGNAVICKPSELTPLSAVLAANLWLESGGPPDILLVATGDGTTGAALVDRVDHVHLTGSVATGRAVAQQAAARLVPCSLELGGNDAMVVLADADLDRAAAACVHYALYNTGQVCMSVERVYVEAAVHDAFVQRVAAIVGTLTQGAPAGPGASDVSALINAAQLDIVRTHVADALEKGARLVTGGDLAVGAAPTVLADVDHSMLCMTEETFGPTIPIMAVADADEAIALANDSRYGLTASVWTRDTRRGEALARRLEVGTVTVNDAMFHLGDVELPMGGWKHSGHGARNGADGIRRFTRTKVVQVATTIGSTDPSWMPYDARRSRLVAALYDRAMALPLPRLPSVPRAPRVPGARAVTGVARSVADRTWRR